MQLSQRRRTLQRTGSTAKASKCFGAVISSPEQPKETELCTLLYKPAKTYALFADSLAVPLSYRCSTRSKASVRKLCLLPTVAIISDCPPGHAFEVSKERFLEENDFSCSWPLSRRVEQQCQRNGPISRCMRLHAWPSASCHGQRGRLRRVYASCTCREKFGPRPIFKIFSLGQIHEDQEKRRLGNADPRSTEARRQMLLTTSWSHTSSWASLSSIL